MSGVRFRFLEGPRREQEISFPGPTLRMGRSRDCDLVVPDEEGPASSGYHAEVVHSDGEWWIQDLSSTNGTFVNGGRVERSRLRDGDRIGLGGPPLLEFRLARGRSRPVALVAGLVALALGVAAAAFWSSRPEPSFETAAARAARSVYLVTVEQDGVRTAAGSAFALSRDGLLATNAHVALALVERGSLTAEAPATAYAALSDGDGRGIRIVSVEIHPQHEAGSFRYDVALLRLAGEPDTVPMPLASPHRLEELRRGRRIAAFGFPAPATDPEHPRARLSEDVVGDVRDGRFLEVGLRITPGMSGSPVFTRDGSVVGLVVGGDFVRGPDGESVSSGVNWVLSVAALREPAASY